MFNFIQLFHFLEPKYFLLLAPLTLLVGYLLHKRSSRLLKPTKAIAPHLLAQLSDKPDKVQGYGPILAITLVVVVIILVLAKPVWSVAQNSQDKNPPLYIVMDESLSMNKADVIPNRNLKAQLIVKNLIQSGINRPIAIVAMSGSSHILLPPSDDQNLLSLYLSYLDPKVMPRDGGDLKELVKRMETTDGLVLENSSVLLVTDGGLTGEQAFSDFVKKYQITSSILYMSELGGQVSKELNSHGFDGASMSVTSHALQSYFMNKQAQGSDGVKWQDESHWLIIFATCVVALWFRKGWTLQWAIALFVLLPFSQPSQAAAIDWFMTQDQQGMVLMYLGKYQQAQEHFEDSNWKGVACYYQEDFKCAQREFAKSGNATAIFNMGNAAAQDGRYKTAQQLYQALLAIQTDNTKAKQNLKQINEILLEMKMLSENQHDSHPPSEDAVPPKDANEISDGAKRKSYGQIPHSKLTATDVLSSEAATDKWLRDISLDPKEFVRRKFLSEYSQEITQ
ncbi:VWA domain-containing protein [Vibrio harveyi]